MKGISHMSNSVVWQAYAYAWVNQESLNEGRYPNGKVLKPNDIIECNQHIDRSIEIMNNYNSDYPANVVIARNLPHDYNFETITEPIKQGQLELFC